MAGNSALTCQHCAAPCASSANLSNPVSSRSDMVQKNNWKRDILGPSMAKEAPRSPAIPKVQMCARLSHAEGQAWRPQGKVAKDAEHELCVSGNNCNGVECVAAFCHQQSSPFAPVHLFGSLQ